MGIREIEQFDFFLPTFPYSFGFLDSISNLTSQEQQDDSNDAEIREGRSIFLKNRILVQWFIGPQVS